MLRELAARKNAEFRGRFIGRAVSVVTLAEGALSDNFIKVELATPRTANRLMDVKIGALSDDGLRESAPFVVL